MRNIDLQSTISNKNADIMQKILDVVRKNPYATEEDIAKILGLKLEKVYSTLDIMQKQGIVIVRTRKERKRRLIDPGEKHRRKRELRERQKST